MTSSLIASAMLRDPIYHIECLTAPSYTKYLISSPSPLWNRYTATALILQGFWTRCSATRSATAGATAPAGATLAPYRRRSLAGLGGHIAYAALPRLGRTAANRFQPNVPAVDVQNWAGSPQLVQQRLRVLQIGRVEPLREPAVDRGEEV